jgi:hypothetical protein
MPSPVDTSLETRRCIPDARLFLTPDARLLIPGSLIARGGNFRHARAGLVSARQ